MSNSTVQTALFFDVFLYFFDVSEQLALISLNMVICPVYDFGWPVLGGEKNNSLTLGPSPYVFKKEFGRLGWLGLWTPQLYNFPKKKTHLFVPRFLPVT